MATLSVCFFVQKFRCGKLDVGWGHSGYRSYCINHFVDNLLLYCVQNMFMYFIKMYIQNVISNFSFYSFNFKTGKYLFIFGV